MPPAWFEPALLQRLLHTYGDAFVFGLLVLDSAGLPLPGETVLIAAAFYAARGHGLSLGPLLASAASGAVLGGMLGYGIGWRFGAAALNRLGPRIGYTEDRQFLAHYLLDRYGAALIAAGRFFALLRPVENILAGATGMRFRRFMLGNVLGGVSWTTVYCVGVFLAGKRLTDVAGRAATLAGLAALVALVAGFWLLRRQEARLLARARAAAARARPIRGRKPPP